MPYWMRRSHAEMTEEALAAAEAAEAEAAAAAAAEEETLLGGWREGDGSDELGAAVAPPAPGTAAAGAGSGQLQTVPAPQPHAAAASSTRAAVRAAPPHVAAAAAGPSTVLGAARVPAPVPAAVPAAVPAVSATAPAAAAPAVAAPPAAEPGEEGRLDRFTILSDDEDGGAVKGYQPRRRRGAPDPAATGGSNPAALLAGAADNLGWADSSSSDEEDPWGVDDVDEFGYPLEFVRQRKAAAGTDAEAPGVADSPERGGVAERGEGEGAGDETSSNGSWGVDYQHLGGAQHLQQASLAAHCAPAALTPETLQQLAAAKLAQHAASSASGAEGSAAQLLAEFGLAKERVPHPNDIPPLAFAAPPAWLTKPIPDFYEYYRDSPKPMATDSDADSVVVVAASGAGWNSGAAGAPGQLKQKSVGRVQDALQQAKRQQAARVVDHDAYTFHFTAPPDGV